ncbi:MAG TPA: class F sortase [Candidatus Paceibacterota bacterium]|nr:class F sortase [Candidatus Paceibacterota bacterium]
MQKTKRRTIVSAILVSAMAAVLLLAHVSYAPLDSLLQERFSSAGDVFRGLRVSTAAPVIADAGAPSRFLIPRLGIDAEVQPVGVNAKGAVGTPTRFKDVAWYREGPKPGEEGGAVINGHLDNALGLPGVFYRLPTVEIGDEVQVLDEKGTIMTFSVYAIDRYPYNQALSPDLMETAGRAELRIITCTGSWLSSKKTYSERLVVSARLTRP